MHMPNPMHPAPHEGLERLCMASPRDWIRIAPRQSGIERLEAYFAGHGYDPHRHDTYAIGVTLSGVQLFDYRGTTVHSHLGRAITVHPDEVHDGRAGTGSGFRYRIAYIEPRLIQAALGDKPRPLPFTGAGTTDDARLIAAIMPALQDLETPLEDLQLDQIIAEVAAALVALDRSNTRPAVAAASLRAVDLARDFLDANVEQMVASEQLEGITGLDRFALARHFRACLGTSPYRYQVMRRLDRARRLMQAGASLVEAAAISGFADQSHMTRQFKKAYGISPGRWQRATSPLKVYPLAMEST
jgi:AraC-like DNA-binding protein